MFGNKYIYDSRKSTPVGYHEQLPTRGPVSQGTGPLNFISLIISLALAIKIKSNANKESLLQRALSFLRSLIFEEPKATQIPKEPEATQHCCVFCGMIIEEDDP